ncbi:MAG: FimV/HubP family polar landmark protein [Candidatus Competibacterales bacterium]
MAFLDQASRLLRDISRNPVEGALLGGGLVLLVGLPALFLMRRRRRAEEPRETAIGEVDNSQLLSELQVDGDTREQIDLLLAVGNFREAEVKVREELERDPNDPEMLVKLLDVHFASDNADEFLADARHLHGLLDDPHGPLWQYVCKLGRQICPGHPLFDSRATADDIETAPSDDYAGDATDFDDLFADSPEDLRRNRGMPSQGPSTDDLAAFGFGTADDDDRGERGYGDDDRQDDDGGFNFDSEVEDFDFDASDLANDATQMERSAAGQGRRGGAAEDDFDFDFGDEPTALDSQQPAPIEKEFHADPVAGADRDALSDELEQLQFELPAGNQDSERTTQRRVDADVDTFDFDEYQGADDPTLGDDEAGLPRGAEDDIDVKLDLAQAYVEMDDRTGARDLLNEVLREGSDEQRQRAQAMMSRIAT